MMRKLLAMLLIWGMCFSMCACSADQSGGDSGKIEPTALSLSQAAQECKSLIDAIGEVSLDSEEAVAKAEAAYEKLSGEEQALLADAATALTNARKKLDVLIGEAQQKTRVDKVIGLINAVGTVSLKSADAIKEAQAAYDALPKEDKSLVTNYAVLEKAQEEFTNLKKAEKEGVIKEYSKKFDIDTDKVEQISWYMPKDMPEYIDTRCYLIPYIGVRNDGAWVCVRYNYTEDDWIFWESLKIVVDGESYTKTVGPFKTTRDNDGGVVWENYDEILSVNADMDDATLQMLKAIAESKETIVRFQGDDYYYDLTVSKKDKNMIKDVLKLYEALLP